MSTLLSDPASRAVACLTTPSLALRCELVDRPGLDGAPLALSDEAGARVADVTPAASAYGVRPGMTLREASALCPLLGVVEPRPALVARHAAGLVEAMAAVSPLVEEAAPGMVYADLRGTARLYPRIDDVGRAVFGAVPAALHPRLGVAGRRFTARIAATQAAPGTALHVLDADAAAFLASEPASSLPLSVEAADRLRLLGIDTCGAFAALPRHAVEAQFGTPGGTAWLAARGEDPRPLRPRPPARERVMEEVQAEPPLVSREAILHALEQLLGRTLRHPRAQHRFVRSFRVSVETERGGLWEREQVLREPLGDRARLWGVIRTVVEYAAFPGPCSAVSLELGGLTAESGRQWSLFDADRTRRQEDLDVMVRQLKLRYGHTPVGRIVPLEPGHRLPERRQALLDYDP